MTISAPPDSDVCHGSERNPIFWLASFVEASASLTVLHAIWVMLINKADTMIAFFGETPTVAPDNVSTYHRSLTMLAIGVAVSFIAALWRKRRANRWLYWHGLVLLTGLLAASTFRVGIPSPDNSPVQDRPGSVCLSSGDNSECLGG